MNNEDILNFTQLLVNAAKNIQKEKQSGYRTWQCRKCNYVALGYDMKYCPYCGCHMDAGAEWKQHE